MYALLIAACLLADAPKEPVIKIEETINIETKGSEENSRTDESVKPETESHGSDSFMQKVENPSSADLSSRVPAQQKQEATFLTPYEVSQPNRVALTPHLSGKIHHECWNLFTKNLYRCI